MGCCCSCCRPIVGDLESCGNVRWPTVDTGACKTTRTNQGEILCHRVARYHTVPLCDHHREFLKASILQDARNTYSVRNHGPPDQVCLPADKCAVRGCSNAFACRASICSEHFQELVDSMKSQSVPAQPRMPAQTELEVVSPIDPRLDNDTRSHHSELEGTPTSRNSLASELEPHPVRTHELDSSERHKGQRALNDGKDAPAADVAPPPYQESVAGPSSPTSNPGSDIQRVTKSPRPT